jgi:multidrug efflux pump subunit AcrA (membrane-fusion protein)
MKLSSLFLILAALAATSCAEPETDAQPELVVSVRTAKAERRDVQAVTSAPATIFARSEARLAPKLTAPIITLEAKKGDRVDRGQVLARLQRNDLEAQREQAAAQLADARANLEKVSAGTLPADIGRAQGDVDRASAALAEAKQVYERRKILLEEGALPEREVLSSKTVYDQAVAADRVARRSLELLSSQSREQDIRMAQSRVAQADAALRFAETQLGYTEIRSPTEGFVIEQFLFPGDMAGPASPVFTVADLSLAVARAQVPEANTAGIAIGKACWFARLDAPEVRFEGTTTVVNRSVDPSRRTVEVWCEIPNRDASLNSGAFGQAAFVTADRAAAVTVPRDAVDFHDEGRTGTVWTLDAAGAVHANEIRLGVAQDGTVEILEGLSAGSEVVVEGAYGLAEGMRARKAASGEGDRR